MDTHITTGLVYLVSMWTVDLEFSISEVKIRLEIITHVNVATIVFQPDGVSCLCPFHEVSAEH